MPEPAAPTTSLRAPVGRPGGRAQRDPNVVAVVCEFAGGCSAVIARIEQGQSFTNVSISELAASPSALRDLSGRRVGRCRVSQAATFTKLTDPACVRLIADAAPSRIIRVLAPDACITRSIQIPGLSADANLGASDQGLKEALQLAAEAEMPGVPAWRRSAGWVQLQQSLQAPGAMLQAWHTNAAVAEWPNPAQEYFLSPPAAMYGLAMLHPQLALAAALQRSAAGAVALFAAGPDRVAIRTSRASGAGSHEPADWQTSVGKIIDETARNAGWLELDVANHSAGLPDSGLVLLLPDRAATELSDENSPPAPALAPVVARDPALLLCLGALVIATSDRPAIASLASLTRHEVRPSVPVWRRAALALSRPRVAVAIIAAALIFGLFMPLASALARESILQERAKQLDLDRRLAESERRIGFYSLLRERRWPMTKLMADIAGAAPVGVEIDTLDLNQGEPITVRGRAERPDLVASFRENLTKSKVFTQVTTPSVEADASGVKFQLVARIEGNRAFYPGERAADFSVDTLAVRLYGADAAAVDNDDLPTQTSNARDSSPRSGRPSRAADSPAQPAPRPAATQPPPPPLTDAQLAEMDATKAMLEWSSRKAAASRATDDELKRRLNEESERARQRMLELRRSAPAGGAPSPTTGGTGS